ncbi:MAG: DNA alkylation repair protein [Ignavibacteria bacterium]|nr:DNA alkylation repair protein [Ignavibacteria bacterium]
MSKKMYKHIVDSIRTQLSDAADEETRKAAERYFREPILCYGLKNAEVHKIGREHWAEVKKLEPDVFYLLCEDLFQSNYTEEAFIAADWLAKSSKKFRREDLPLFRRWIDQYINNWAKCDSLCNHAMGDFIDRYPDAVAELKLWARSANRWMRRAAAVTLILPARRGDFLQDAFELADILLTDADDMVQKGYGWLLKEASKKHQEEVFNFVVERKSEMPRTALRYAIEKMPQNLRIIAMSH